MQKIRRIIYLATLGAIGLLVLVINPLFMLLTSFSLIMFLAMSRHLNFYKVAMMIKRYAQDASKLRLEIRAKLHSGFKDYNGSMECEEPNNKSYGFVR